VGKKGKYMRNSRSAFIVGLCILSIVPAIRGQDTTSKEATPTQTPGVEAVSTQAPAVQAPAVRPAAAEATPKEAGKYERKSVTFINALWLMDGSVRALSPEKVAFILDNVKTGMTMSRFDYNPVPESFATDFVNQANAVQIPPTPAPAFGQMGLGLGALGAAPDPMLDSITAILERTVVPKILQAVDVNKELRAANLTSEQERNSFITDKAKMLGITMEDIRKVMNSAFVYIPIIRRFHEEMKDSSYSMGFDPGIIWFRIVTTGDKAHAVPVVRKFTTTQGFGRLGKNYSSSAGLIDYKEFAFRSAVKNAVRNLVKATQDIPEFILSGQVLERGFMSVSFDLGKKEGVKIDDKYHIIEMVEEPSGAVSQNKKGWLMVTSVGDSSSRQGYKSKGQVIAGSPYIGAVLKEFPRIPIDIILRGKMFAFATDSAMTTDIFDSLKLSNAYGFGIDAQYNIGRGMGINQLFFDFGFGMGFGSASGALRDVHSSGVFDVLTSVKLTSCGTMTFAGSLVKKFYMGRLAIVLEPAFSFQTVTALSDKADDTYYRAINSNLGMAVNGGVEIALGAAVNFGVGAGYQFFGTSKDWDVESKTGTTGTWSKIDTYKNNAGLNYTGLTAQIYFTWSVPGLPFDPIDMIRANAGI
jgi:hypothetical protein